ncbi:hypothetical protein CPC08DRAFT_752475 [Agrocybe pediades]|nr:hypothetical protein CPC08DRAFT_752475 [Agrocybe pediades]
METEEYPPKAHSVLCIPELLRLTFQLSDPASNAVNARVCKRWSEIALDCLWADVDDLLRLLKLLAPMTVVKGTRNVFDFQRSPQVHDWRRFEKYAKRVRRLTYDVKELPSPRVIRFSAFDTLARTRLRLDFLPNLQSLTWIGPLNYSIIFMHDRISHFAISLSGEGPSLPLYFLDVVSRMPNLITLDIRSSIPMSKIQSEMTAMLGALTHLISVTFPPYYLTGEVVEALSLHPRLAEIEFEYEQEQGIGKKEDVSNFTPGLAEGAFPALKSFAAILGFGDATRLIGLPHFPAANLTKLFLDSTSILAPDDIRSLLSAVMDNCQSLTGLSILSPRNLSPDDLASLDEGVCTTFHTIQPLLKLHGLTSFEFVQPFPLLLQQRDLEVIACSWPCMEILRLNSHPVTSHQTTSTLEGLIPFAEYCPNLTELDLFLDATRTDLPDPTVHFKALKFLDVGLSKIKDVDAVALYLCQILPEGCINGPSSLFAFLFLLTMRYMIKRASKARPATPPTTPPAIAPTCEELVLFVLLVLVAVPDVEVGAGELVDSGPPMRGRQLFFLV